MDRASGHNHILISDLVNICCLAYYRDRRCGIARMMAILNAWGAHIQYVALSASWMPLWPRHIECQCPLRA